MADWVLLGLFGLVDVLLGAVVWRDWGGWHVAALVLVVAVLSVFCEVWERARGEAVFDG